MEKDYQIIIDKKRFDHIMEKSFLSEKLIKEKAYELWGKEGRVLVSINLCLKSARKDIEGYDEYRFDNYCYLSERGKFIKRHYR